MVELIPKGDIQNWTSVTTSINGMKLAACVIDGFIYTSTDCGETWIQRGEKGMWFKIVSSANGNILAAITFYDDDNDSNNGYIYISIDSGETWNQCVIQNEQSSKMWYNDIALSADGSKLVACVLNGFIYTSIDYGKIWNKRATKEDWVSVASSADGNNLVACTSSFKNGNIYISNNSGISWNCTSAPPANWNSVTSSADGKRLFACITIEITKIPLNVDYDMYDPYDDRHMDRFSNRYDYKEEGGYIYLSEDSGMTWNRTRAPQGYWEDIKCSNDGRTLVALDRIISLEETLIHRIYISNNSGETWIQINREPKTFRTIELSKDGTRLITCIKNEHIYIINLAYIFCGSLQDFKQKYLKYKQKYLNLKNF